MTIETAPKSKLEQLTDEIVLNLKRDTDGLSVKVLKDGHYKYVPGSVVQLEFNHAEKGETVTTVNFDLEGENRDEFIFAHMTTLPKDNNGLGYGRNVIGSILKTLEKRKDLKFIRAVQVQNDSENFWQNMNFKKLGNSTNDFEYIKQ